MISQSLGRYAFRIDPSQKVQSTIIGENWGTQLKAGHNVVAHVEAYEECHWQVYVIKENFNLYFS